MPISYPPVIDEKGRRTDKNGKEICGKAIKGRSDLYCSRGGRKLDPSTRRCIEEHAQKFLKGLAHGNFKNGRNGPYLKNLPQRMIPGVVRNLNDPKRLELEHELAVTRERAADLMRRVDNGESGHLWKRLKETFVELKIAIRSGDEAAVTGAVQMVDEFITRGTSDYQAWEEISKLMVQAKQIAESEQKRSAMFAPMDQTLELIREIAVAIRRCVEDAQIRDAVQREIEAIYSARVGHLQRDALVVLDGEIDSIEVSGTDL